MGDLFGRPWERPGYSEVVRALLADGELHVEFGNGDTVKIPLSQLGLDEGRNAAVDLSGSAVVVEASGSPVEISWSRLRELTDSFFAEELRNRDAEEARRIGKRLKALREDKGISQKRLADTVRMSPAQLSKIETGRYDLRLSTVNRLLRAMDSTLAEVTGPSVPEQSQAELARAAQAQGLPRELFERIAKVVARSDMAAAVARILGVDDRSGSGAPVPPSIAVQFKSGDPDAAKESPLIPIAHRLSGWVTAAIPGHDLRPISTDPTQIRADAMDEAGHVTLQSLVNWTWAKGIPCIPIHAKGPFTAATWLVDRRPVAVIKERRTFAAFWLFDLAHEIGHIALGHIENDGVVDVESPLEHPASDEQERSANDFALEIVLPNHSALLEEVRADTAGNYMRFKFAVERVAARHNASVGMLGFVAAFEMTEVGQYKDRWGSASNLARAEGDGESIVRQALARYMDPASLTPLDRLMLSAIVL